MTTTVLNIVFHYPKRDTTFSMDYIDVELFVDGEFHRAWGDAYHDRGGVQAESYVEGYTSIRVPGQTFEVKRTYVADRDI